MAKKKFDAAALAAQFGLDQGEVKVASQPEPKKNPDLTPQAGPKTQARKDAVEPQSLDKPQEGEIAIYMDLDKVHGHPNNRRMKPESAIVELAMNIDELGLIEFPLAWVNPQGECQLLSGHHRYLAYKWLRDNVDAEKYAQIPIRFREGVDTEAKALRILHSANFYNEGLLPSERAQSAAIIYESGDLHREKGTRSVEVVAELLNTNARSISRLLRLHRNLSDDIKRLWDTDILTQAQAEELAKLSVDTQEAFYELVKDSTQRLTKNQFDMFCKKATGTKKKAVGRPKDPSKQIRTYVQGIVKKGKEVQAWKDEGGTVDPELLNQLKEIVRMLEE